MKTIYLFYGAGLLAFAAVLTFLFDPDLFHRAKSSEVSTTTSDDRSQRIKDAIDGASQICLADISVKQKRHIETSLFAKLGKAGSKGDTSTEETKKYVDLALSEAGILKAREAVQACMEKQTMALLNYDLSSRIASLQLREAARSDPTLSQAAIGYVYYEENNGKLTNDGVFRPLKLNDSVPAYKRIKKDDVLVSVRSAQLRAGPTGLDIQIRTLDVGQCVKVLENPGAPLDRLTQATSGGRLKVQAIACPQVQVSTGGSGDRHSKEAA